MYADLHTHTVASDGTFTPEALVHAAHEKRITLLAVADHDTTASVAAAKARCEMLGIRLLPAVELSCDGAPGECHMLGLKVDIENADFQAALAEYSENRRTRNARMIERLNAIGVGITMEDVVAAAPEGSNIGRPHFAQAMVNRKYVPDTKSAFVRYIGDDAPGYVPKAEPTPAQAIAMIHNAGGLAFLAHPGFLKMAQQETYDTRLNMLKRAGMDGIEAYYSAHSPADTAKFLRLAEKYGLLVSGGSDFHGDIKPDVPLGIVWGGNPLPLAKLPQILRD